MSTVWSNASVAVGWGSSIELNIADFGLAQLLQGSSELTRTGDFVGTAAWMAPERAVLKPGAATTAVDVYGVGAILYFLLTGRAPFAGESLLETLMRVREGSVVSPRKLVPAIDRDLEMVCLMPMDRDPSRLYATAEELAKDLDRYIQGEPLVARPLPQYAQWARRMKRHPVVTAIVSTVLLATAVLLGMGTFYTVQQAQLTDTLDQKTTEARIFSESTARLRAEAEVIRDEALTARRDHRELLYAAHIRQVGDALAAGDVRQADDFLTRQLPAADDSDLRGLEWYWLRKQSSIGKPLHEVPFSNPRCLQFSPDKRWLAVGDSEGESFLLNADTMEIVRSWTTPHEMVESVSFSPSSELLATAGDNLVAVWYVGTSQLQHSMSMPVERLTWQASFIDNQRLVAWSRRGKVMVLDTSDPTSQTELVTDVGEVRDVVVWRPRKLLAVLGRTGLQRFDAESLEQLSMLPFPKNLENCTNVRFVEDGQGLAMSDGNQTIYVHGVRGDGSHTLRACMVFPDDVREFDVSPDGTQLVACSNIGSTFVGTANDSAEVMVNQDESTVRWQAHQDRINAVAFSPSGKEVVTLSRDDRLCVWHPSSEPPVRVVMSETVYGIFGSHIAG